jgi:hypothetical protein
VWHEGCSVAVNFMLSTPSSLAERTRLPAAPPGEALEPGLLQRIRPFIGRIEIAAGVILTLASVFLHVLQNRTAGGLWRDEATSAQVASLPALSQVWRYLEFDSYPALFHMVLRGWGWIFGAGDGSLRALGLLIGLGLLAAIWGSARSLGIRVPLFALALLGLNPMVIRYGDSVRAYGLGCALAALTFAAVWKVAASARLEWRRIAWACALAILSVQCTYNNVALLVTACFSAAGVALWQRRPKAAGVTLLIGLPSALSLLPYLPIIARVRVWSVLLHDPLTPGLLWDRLSEVTGAPDPLGIWLWSLLAIAGVAVAACDSGDARRLTAGAALILGVVIYGGFLIWVGYPTHQWYYLAFLTVAGLCLDTIFGLSSTAPGWRLARLAVTLLFAITVFVQSAAALRLRNTSMDLIAARLNAVVAPGDLVLVNQWECAISLHRYYHGKARVMTVPPLDDHLVHRYDLIQRDMQTADPLRLVYAAIADALRGGGRLWFIGWPLLPEKGVEPPVLPPIAPPADGHWPFETYTLGWMIQADMYLNSHARRCVEVEIPASQPINPFEDQPVRCYSGWH